MENANPVMRPLICRFVASPLLALALLGGVAAAQDMADALDAYRSGDPRAAVALLEPLARSGDGTARTLLAQAYDTGRGVSQDHQRALSLYRAAASQGLAEASYRLAVLLAEGRPGIPADVPQAIVHLEEAMAADYPQAFTMRGLLLLDGRGGDPDPAAALALFRRAHLLGDPGGSDQLAGMLLRGEATERDEAAALELWRDAATNGHGPSIANLGRLYDTGVAVPQDSVAAFALYRLAAASGAKVAGRILSGIHADPESRAFDPLRALAWCIWSEGMVTPDQEDPCAPRRANLDAAEQAKALRLSRRLLR